MTDQELAKRVEKLSQGLILDTRYKGEIEFLMRTFSLTVQQIYAAWLLWDTKKSTYSNEVYSSEALRLVMHLHNYLAESWHEKRQMLVSNHLQAINAQRICDVGFGVPQSYVRSFLSRPGVSILLADFEASSLSFAEQLLTYWDSDWKRCVDLLVFDMNHDNLPSGFETYLFQDSIEHADDPSGTLQRFVASVPTGTSMLFSLPIEIEKPVPEHHIYWHDEQEVLTWLRQAGLKILSSQTISMDKTVDLFSLFLHPDFREVVVLTQK